MQAGPENRRYSQAHQQQEQRQSPAGSTQGAGVEVFGKSHVIHVWHHKGGGKEHQQQGSPGTFLQRRVQRDQGLLIAVQPQLQALRSVKDHVQRIQADGGNGDQFDHRLEGNRHDQAFVLFPRGDVPRAEQDGKQNDQDAEAQRDGALSGLGGQNLHRVGHRLYLQCEQRQYADQHEQGGQGAGPGAAKTKGKQIGQRRQLIGAGNAQDGVEQYRSQQKGTAHAEVVGEKTVAILVRQPHGAVKRPGAGVHPE